MKMAFDTLKEQILREKLSFYEFTTDAIEFVKSLLTGRVQFVYINGVFSNGRIVLFGVPQGSRVGPLIFDIYVNDVPVNIDDEVTDASIYADDVGAKVRGTTVSCIQIVFNDCT